MIYRIMMRNVAAQKKFSQEDNSYDIHMKKNVLNFSLRQFINVMVSILVLLLRNMSLLTYKRKEWRQNLAKSITKFSFSYFSPPMFVTFSYFFFFFFFFLLTVLLEYKISSGNVRWFILFVYRESRQRIRK